MNEFAVLFLGALFWENLILQQVLGLEPFLIRGRLSVARVLKAGVLTTGVVALLALSCWLWDNLVLIPNGLEFLRNISFLLFLLLFAYPILMLGRQFNWFDAFDAPESEEKNGRRDYLLFVLLNSLLLGFVFQHIGSAYTLGELFALICGTGLGLIMVVGVISGIEERLVPARLSPYLRGIPLRLIILGFFSFIVAGFNGF